MNSTRYFWVRHTDATWIVAQCYNDEWSIFGSWGMFERADFAEIGPEITCPYKPRHNYTNDNKYRAAIRFLENGNGPTEGWDARYLKVLDAMDLKLVVGLPYREGPWTAPKPVVDGAFPYPALIVWKSDDTW